MKGHWAERNVGVDGVRVVPARERGGARVFILAAAAEGMPHGWEALARIPWRGPGCTGIIARNTLDGTVNHARNLDFAPVEFMKPLACAPAPPSDSMTHEHAHVRGLSFFR